MKKILLCFCLGACALSPTLATPAQLPSSMTQTTSNPNSNKALFNIVTYNEKGDLLRSGNGFFIDEQGTGIAAFTLFDGAYRAEVIDYKGDKLPVHRILGANSTYDLVKFSTLGAKKIAALALAEHPQCDAGTPVQLLTYTGKKKANPTLINIKKADDFNGFKYYEVQANNEEKFQGCPLTDATGAVVAIAQRNIVEGAQHLCAVDSRFIQQLQITNMSILNSDLQAIKIPKGLPENEKDALTYIYMLGYKDSIPALHANNDFIASYPENAEGYTNRGTFYAQHRDYAHSEQDFAQALELAGKEKSTIKADEVYNKISKLMLAKVMNDPQTTAPNWTIDNAIAAAHKAYELNASPFHMLQQAHCLLQKKEYKQAYDNYYRINTQSFDQANQWSAQAKIETWDYAARAYELGMQAGQIPATREDSLHLITLADSLIAALPKPYYPGDAHCFFERAQRYQQLGFYQKAVLDLFEYEKIIGPKNLNDKFYYMREQLEMKARMYQQALDDIRTAKAFNPKDPFYPVEEALVLLNAGLYPEAIETCATYLKQLPGNPDCYKIMGIAYGQLGKKKEALTHLQKAKELGDPTADAFIQKYQ